MTITIPMPASLEQAMQPTRVRLHLAIGAFTGEDMTLGQASDIAGMSQTEFMGELSRRRIPLHYDRAEFAEDLKSIALLNERLDHARHQ
jgi:predicted HTH domain antitoxin